MQYLPASLAATVAFATAAATQAGEIDFAFTPVSQTVAVGDIAEVQLVVSSSDSNPQPFDAIDAIFTWDPDVLEFIESDQSDAGAIFFLAGFLPDPDGINDDVSDGDALFTALVQPGQTVDAPPSPGHLIITTLRFRALQDILSTEIAYLPEIGDFGRTRALLAGFEQTGDTSAVAKIVVLATDTCPWDLSGNGSVGFLDLLILLEAWGPNPAHPADFDGDGVVGFTDLLKLLSAWGPCPPP